MPKRMDEIIRGNRGFQMVELLIVMALISIMLAIGVPALLSQMSHLRLTRTVRNIAIELNAARLKAIAKNTKYSVSFTGSPPDVFTLQVWNGASYTADTSQAPKSIESGVSISSISNTTIEFYPTGTTGTATDASICVQNASSSADRMKITVQHSTGMIKVETGC